MIDLGQKAGIGSYRQTLRSIVRGYWSGVLSAEQFEDAMRSAINRRLQQAFEEGARECGVRADELTQAEFTALGQAIRQELTYVAGFGEAISQNNKANKGKLEPLLARVDLWVNRYRDLGNRGRQLACSDSKLLWVIGPAEQHCRDCSGFNGRVYRGSVWSKKNVRPQHPKLACHGFNCLCSLSPTDLPVTRGSPPAMTG
ncbi:MAG: hypothetical protein ACREIQ_09285 [Nitrospiria bacterium]